MAREDPHFRLRFPDDLRAKVEKASGTNRRSMTAEIISRLENSFAKNIVASFDPDAAEPDSRLPGLEIVIDSSGYPQSWAEIHEHIAAITQAGDFNPSDLHVRIVSPPLISSSERREAAEALSDHYRDATAVTRLKHTRKPTAQEAEIKRLKDIAERKK